MWLNRLRGIMSVSQFEGERALESVTAPIYRCELYSSRPARPAIKNRSTCIYLKTIQEVTLPSSVVFSLCFNTI